MNVAAEHLRSPRLNWRRLLYGPVATVAVTVVVGMAVARQLGRIGAIPPIVYLAVVPVGVALHLLRKDMRWGLAAVLAATILGLYRRGVAVGPVDLRLVDVAFVFLVGWVLAIRPDRGRPARTPMGHIQIGVLLLALGYSLVPVIVQTPSTAPDLLLSFLRILESVSLVWLVPYALRTDEDRLFVLRSIVVLSSLELLRGLAEYFAGHDGDRLSGGNGPNAEGLIAVVLIVLVLHSPVPRARWARTACLVIGTLALVSTRSVGSIVALGIVLGAAGLRSNWATDARARALLRPLRVPLMVIGVVALVGSLRPLNLPGSTGFESSTTSHRIVVGAAGLEIFRDHPFLGVGWQRSSLPEVIGDPKISDRLRRRFPDARPSFFPDVTPTTVHSGFVQLLAETGIVGFSAFVVATLVLSRRMRQLLRRLQGEQWQVARAAMLVTAAVFVWWNDNPFFGAQPETILPFVMIGLLASFGPAAPPSVVAQSVVSGEADVPAEDAESVT